MIERLTQVGAAADQSNDGVLVVQHGGVLGRRPHVAAAGRVRPLEQLLELCRVAWPLRWVDAARVVLPGVLQAAQEVSQALSCRTNCAS